MNKPIYLSVVIPAYNEQFNFRRGSLNQVYKFLASQKYAFEIVIVDDGSTDHTLELIREFAIDKPEVVILGLRHQGKGPTVREGMLAAKGECRLFTDFDQSTPISEVEKLLKHLEQGFEVVIGSREIDGARREGEPRYRHLMGKGFNLVVRLLAVHGINDTQCGFKLLTSAATKALFPRLKITTSPRSDSFTGAFDVELLFLARKLGYRTAEVPVHWTHMQTARVNPLKDSIRMFWDVVRIRWAYLTNKYD
jgi:dolichyl-phosphate beta-glucosyltransferase